MFCRQCGKMIPGDSIYCPECGAPTKNAQNSTQKRNAPRMPNQNYAPPNSAAPVYSTTKPVKKRTHLLRKIVLSVLFIVVVVSVINAIRNTPVGGEKEEKTQKIVQAPPLEKEEENETETDYTESGEDNQYTPEPKPEPVRISVGETGTLGDLEVKVTGYKFSQYAGDLGTLNKAQSGLAYCVIYVDVKNIGTNTLELVGMFDTQNYEFSLVYDGENKYGQTWANFSDFLAANETIPSKGTLQGKLLNFSVPVEMQSNNLSMELHLKYNSIWKDEEVIWTLR